MLKVDVVFPSVKNTTKSKYLYDDDDDDDNDGNNVCDTDS